MLKELYNSIKDISRDFNLDFYMEFVDDIECYDELVEGVVLYFPTGEALQMFIENNKIVVLDENIAILTRGNDVFGIANIVVNYADEKIKEIYLED